MKNETQTLYFLLRRTARETHDTACCCGMPTNLPHTAYAASIYVLDAIGLQALFAMLAGLEGDSFPDWCDRQEPYGVYYGSSDDASFDEALLHARKQGLLLINYPQSQDQEAADIAIPPYIAQQFPKEFIALSPTAYVQRMVDYINTYVKKHSPEVSPVSEYIREQTLLLHTYGWYLYYDPYEGEEGAYKVVPLDQVNVGYEVPPITYHPALADKAFLTTLKHQIKEIVRSLDSSQKMYPDTVEARQVLHEISVLFAGLKTHGLAPDDVLLAIPLQEQHSMLETLIEKAKKAFFINLIQQSREEIRAMDEEAAREYYSDMIATVLYDILDDRKVGYSQMLWLCCKEEPALFTKEPQEFGCITNNGSPGNVTAEHCAYHTVYEFLHSKLEQECEGWYQGFRGKEA